MQSKKNHVILTKQEVKKMNNFIELQTIKEWPKYPKIISLDEEKSVYGYIDKICGIEKEIFLQFMCDKKGNLIGKVWNSYFEEEEIPSQNTPFWLKTYKKDLFTRILIDLENKKQRTR